MLLCTIRAKICKTFPSTCFQLKLNSSFNALRCNSITMQREMSYNVYNNNMSRICIVFHSQIVGTRQRISNDVFLRVCFLHIFCFIATPLLPALLRQGQQYGVVRFHGQPPGECLRCAVDFTLSKKAYFFYRFPLIFSNFFS